jgi:hypothetical protein
MMTMKDNFERILLACRGLAERAGLYRHEIHIEKDVQIALMQGTSGRRVTVKKGLATLL